MVPQGFASDTVALDSVVVRSPLPGGAAAIFRFAFNLPPWVQVAAIGVAALIAAAIAALIWRRRLAVLTWLRTRSRPVAIGLAVGVLLCIAGAAAFGTATWNYTQHNNNFCVSCHVMIPAYRRFGSSGHKQLECHDCHQQPLLASMKQIYFQIAERPQSIPPHAKVPNGVCLRCHGQQHPDSIWKQILATAGHTVHLENDTAPLRHIQCTTCHGVQLHRFLPIQQTCAQSGCHDNIAIRLGKMAMQTEMHCVACHRFTVPVGPHVSPDSAGNAMIPGGPECLGCHEMQQILTHFDAAKDPHRGRCGWCHDPHRQTTPQAAVTTCTNAGCHVRPDTLTSMHKGLPPRALADCVSCHQPHTWTVSSKGCLACHRDIFSRDAESRAAARAPPAVTLLPVRFLRTALSPAADSLPPFAHSLHKAVNCAECHSSAHRHGEVTLHSVRDCQTCHHATEQAATCTGCHKATELSARVPVPTVIRTSLSPPRTANLPFTHTAHVTLVCARCHDTPVTLEPSRGCESCHADHHVSSADCRFCHDPAKTAHTRAAHRDCATSGCHQDQAVAALGPTNNVCLVCHQALGNNHHPGQACARCHQVAWQHTGAT